jgi:hypothetical protein
MTGYWKPHSILTGLCEGPGVELPGLIENLGPSSLFGLCPFTVRARCNAIIGAVFTTCYMYPSAVWFCASFAFLSP